MHVLVDTSILIDYVRKPLKQETLFFRLGLENTLFISAVTEYEFLLGRNQVNADFTDRIIRQVNLLVLDSPIVRIAVQMYQSMKQKNMLIGTNDTFIAATALQYDISLATLNIKHFSRIEQDFGLKILTNI